MLYVSFIGELEKIAKARVSTTLELKVNPYELGIHSKREGKEAKGSYRPLAYTMGVPTAAVGGVGLGGMLGPLTEGKMLNFATKSGRKLVKERGQADLKTLIEGPKGTRPIGPKGKAMLANPVLSIKGLALKQVSGISLSKHEKNLLKNIGDVAKRRLKNMPKGMMYGALGAGALKALYNISNFETGRAATPGIRKKQLKVIVNTK